VRLSDLEAVAGRLISGRDRRRDERFPVALPIDAVFSHPDGVSAMLRKVVVEDLTRHGASLSSVVPVKRGWLVKMSLPVGTSKVKVQGRVVRRRPRTTEAGIVHIHGIEFIEQDSDTLDALTRLSTPSAVVPALPPLVETEPEPAEPTRETVSEVRSSIPFQSDFMTTRNAFSQQDASPASTNALLTVLGANARIDGRFVIEESIEVECQISGELHVGGTLVIGEHGEVSADITTVNAIIRGQYEGTLKASGSVEIASTGRVNGTIESNELVIAKGADFTGSVSRIQPAAQESRETTSVASKTQPLIVFETDRQVPVTRVPLVDAPSRSSRTPVELT
jgi:cytoskeletal protein CcmA (bactofilin family)